MATLHCTEFPSERSTLVPRSPHECTSQDFLQGQLQELQAIDRRLHRLSHRLRRYIDVCETGTVSVDDLFTALVLVRLWQDVLNLEGQADALVQSSYHRLAQARLGQRSLALKEVNHG